MTYDRVPPAHYDRALGRESPEERETRQRANADAMREAQARRIADCGRQTLPIHRMPHPHPYVWEVHTSVHIAMLCC